MKAQRIRVISSPSSSTIGFFTLIFATGRRCYANPNGDSRRYLDHMSSLGGERKIATMLFADLVGSTELAAGRDPEEIRGRLEPFFEAARTALEQYGGTVEKFIGDA